MRRNRLRKKLPLLYTLLALASGIAAYIIGLAWIQSRTHSYFSFVDLIKPRVVDVIIAGWLIYFCSSIGSFLNVVAWRMPRGQGIGGRSRCPRCASTLKKRDNVPILGWISLRGRCRSCSLPISRRYPIVELLVGLTLTIIGIAELYSLAIPGQHVHWHGGPLWTPRVSPQLLAIMAYHAVAVSTLWAMVLIRIDRVRLPLSLLFWSAIVLIVPMLVYPTLMIVPWHATRPQTWIPDGRYFDAIMRIVSALVAAAFFGRVLAKGLCPSADLKLDPLGKGTAGLVDLTAMLAIPAVLIGWQSFPAFVILAAALSFFLRPLLSRLPINDGPQGQVESRRALESFAFAIPFALTLHLAAWRYLWQQGFWPSDLSERYVMIVWALSALTVPIFLKDRPVLGADELPNQQGDQESDDGDHG